MNTTQLAAVLAVVNATSTLATVTVTAQGAYIELGVPSHIVGQTVARMWWERLPTPRKQVSWGTMPCRDGGIKLCFTVPA